MAFDEQRGKYVEAMGEDLGGVYFALYSDVVWLHSKWKLYRQLFAHSPERLKSLNDAAGFLFYAVQDILWHDTLLHLARLADRPCTAGQENLSLQRLPALIDDPVLRVETEELVGEACATSAFARPWRHKRFAHNDLDHALATSADPLPGVSRDDIESALRAIRAVMNRLESHYRGATVLFEETVIGLGCGDSLVHYLQLGLEAESERRRRALGDPPGSGDS